MAEPGMSYGEGAIREAGPGPAFQVELKKQSDAEAQKADKCRKGQARAV